MQDNRNTIDQTHVALLFLKSVVLLWNKVWMLGYQCCVTRVGTRTRVHFTRTRTRVQFFSLWLELWLWLRNRDSGPSHARVQAVAAVLCCAVYSDIRYILLFVFMFWKINKCWICGLLDSWLGLNVLFWLWLWLWLWGDDSDSDSDSDSDLTT